MSEDFASVNTQLVLPTYRWCARLTIGSKGVGTRAGWGSRPVLFYTCLDISQGDATYDADI